MTVPAGRPHADAVLQLVDDLPVTVYDAFVPPMPPMPYAVAYVDDGLASRPNLDAVSRRLDVTAQFTCVGEDRYQAQAVADAVRAAVVDKRPAVPGRTSSKVAQDVSEPIRRDDDVTPPRFYAVAVYTFATFPAALTEETP